MAQPAPFAVQIGELKCALLQIQGLREAPRNCWRAQFYTQGRLVCWLRGRNNHVSKAAMWAAECIEYLDKAIEKARRFEASRKAYLDAVRGRP